MKNNYWQLWAAGILSLIMAQTGNAGAAALVDEVKLIADSPAAAASAPLAQSFVVSQAGLYTVKVTDLNSPSALTALRVAVSTSSAIAAQLTVTAPASLASMDVTLAAGKYVVQPLATASAGSFGTFSVVVTPQAGGKELCCTPWTVTGSAASSPPGQSALNSPFTVTTAGSYQLSVTDRAFPAALSDLQLIVLTQPNGVPVPCTITLQAPNCTMTLAAGDYALAVVAKADPTALAGLYSLKIAGVLPLTSVPFAATLPVGGLVQPLNVVVPAAENFSLQLNDLNYPTPLASVKALVTQNAEVLQQSTAPTAPGVPAVIVAAAGTVQVFVIAQPDASKGEGAYAVYAFDGTGTLLDRAVPVVDSTHVGYTFSKLLGAGSYQFFATDYQHPKILASLDALAEQKGVALGTGVAPTAPLAAQAGVLNMLAFTSAPAPSDSGLFGIDLLAGSATGSSVYQVTQGVGAAFQSQFVDIVGSAGKYVVKLTDLGFPANFGQVWLIGTSNRQFLNQLVIGPSVTDKAVITVPAGGIYVINVLAQAGSGQHYGLYGFNLTAAPPAPVVTLTASASTIKSGEHTTLTWTSTDSASCTASGGWSGAVAVSGTRDTTALTADTTFTLSCDGDGGTSAPVSTLVRVTQPVSSGGGGGGALNPTTAWCLALTLLWTLRRRYRLS